MPETNKPVVAISPRIARAVALFAGISGVLILALSLPTLLNRGLPQSLPASQILMGPFNAILLFVLSVMLVSTGRTRTIARAATIVLGMGFLASAIAMLVVKGL